MSNLLDKYNTSTSQTVVDAKKQAEGQFEVNYFDQQSEFQKQFDARTKGDTTVQLSNEDDATKGSWTKTALLYYEKQVDRLGGIFHKYNQRKRDSYYSEINRSTMGVNKQSTPS